jgi:hypothetical protein
MRRTGGEIRGERRLGVLIDIDVDRRERAERRRRVLWGVLLVGSVVVWGVVLRAMGGAR